MAAAFAWTGKGANLALPTLPFKNFPITVQNQITAGTLSWPKPYPSVNKPDETGVDDLWHASVNGRKRQTPSSGRNLTGNFVNANRTHTDAPA